jgi:hypothetical protein
MIYLCPSTHLPGMQQIHVASKSIGGECLHKHQPYTVDAIIELVIHVSIHREVHMQCFSLEHANEQRRRLIG